MKLPVQGSSSRVGKSEKDDLFESHFSRPIQRSRAAAGAIKTNNEGNNLTQQLKDNNLRILNKNTLDNLFQEFPTDLCFNLAALQSDPGCREGLACRCMPTV